MSFNTKITDRDSAGALIPEDESRQLLDELMESSVIFSQAQNQVQMSQKQTRLPVIDSVPSSAWVEGDTGQKSVSKAVWRNVFLNAEPHAVIIPVPQDVVDDIDGMFWDMVRPKIAARFATELDRAAIRKVNGNAPLGWPEGIAVTAHDNGASVEIGTNAAADGGFAADVSDAFEFLENSGYDPSLLIAHQSYRAKARKARDAEGRRLEEISPEQAYGIPVAYPGADVFGEITYGEEPNEESFTPRAVVVDTSQLVAGTRLDITYKVLEEATVTIDGNPVNLAERDMVALRAVGRFGFAVSNAFRFYQEDNGLIAPAAVLTLPDND